MEKKLQVIEMPKEINCPSCGENAFKSVWLEGEGNNHYGFLCSNCSKKYVLYYNAGFGLRPASLSDQ